MNASAQSLHYSFCMRQARIVPALVLLVSFAWVATVMAQQKGTAAKPAPSKPSALSDTPLQVDEPAARPKAPAGIVFPERNIQATSLENEGQRPGSLVAGLPDADKPVEVFLNLDATPLSEVIPLFASPELLSFNYLIDPRVKGAVTMTMEQKMTVRELWGVFEHILRLSGAYISRNAGFLDVLPLDQMPKETRLLAKQESMANVDVRLVPIRYTTAQEVQANLAPFTTEGATVTGIARSNSLLLVETPANVPKLLELIKELDTRGEGAWPHRSIPCRATDPRTIVEELNTVLPVIGVPVADAMPSHGAVKLAALPRLGVVVASAASQELLDEVEKWCNALDNVAEEDREALFFFTARHRPAEELLSALSVFFDVRSAAHGRTRGVTRSKSSALPASGAARTATRTAVAFSAHNGRTVFETPVYVHVDEAVNRLTIRTTHHAHTMIRALLERHDVPAP